MADVITGNPIYVDATNEAMTGRYTVREIQWIDDGALDDGDTLHLILNGVTIDIIVSDISAVSPMVWRAGPWNPGIVMDGITVSTNGEGIVLIFIS